MTTTDQLKQLHIKTDKLIQEAKEIKIKIIKEIEKDENK